MASMIMTMMMKTAFLLIDDKRQQTLTTTLSLKKVKLLLTVPTIATAFTFTLAFLGKAPIFHRLNLFQLSNYLLKYVMSLCKVV